MKRLSRLFSLLVIILIAFFSFSCSDSNSDPSDENVPIVGNSGTLSTSGISYTTVTLSWTAATDNVSSSENLKYLVYYSTSDNINTVSEIESNGFKFGSYTANISTKEINILTAGTAYYFNVLVMNEEGNKSAYSTTSVTTTSSSDTTAPNAPSSSTNNFSAYDITSNSVSLAWTKATDDVDSQSSLRYLVYYSKFNNISTVDGILKNGTSFGSLTANMVYKVVTPLSPETTYYFNTLVMDAGGNKAAYAGKSATTTAE